jgi:hypothetical protein
MYGRTDLPTYDDNSSSHSKCDIVHHSSQRALALLECGEEAVSIVVFLKYQHEVSQSEENIEEKFVSEACIIKCRNFYVYMNIKRLYIIACVYEKDFCNVTKSNPLFRTQDFDIITVIAVMSGGGGSSIYHNGCDVYWY